MHKRTLNELTVTLDLSPHEAPLLVKSGREAGTDPMLLDMNFVRSVRPDTGQRDVFLPGSSLKGALRSYCERIARSVRPDEGPEWCCNPFALDEHAADVACGKRLEGEKSPAARYACSCTACRTFGHTRLGSHCHVSDAYPQGQVTIEQRDGVAIDRISGAVSAGPFNLEVVTRGTFRTRLTLRNFQLWQVGLLAIALRDLGEGRLPVGFGKSKGFGRMSLTYGETWVVYPGQLQVRNDGHDFEAHLYDLAAFEFEGKDDYRLTDADPDHLPLPPGGELKEMGAYGRVVVRYAGGDAVRGLLLGTVGHWRAWVEGWPPTAGEEGGDG